MTGCVPKPFSFPSEKGDSSLDSYAHKSKVKHTSCTPIPGKFISATLTGLLTFRKGNNPQESLEGGVAVNLWRHTCLLFKFLGRTLRNG